MHELVRRPPRRLRLSLLVLLPALSLAMAGCGPPTDPPRRSDGPAAPIPDQEAWGWSTLVTQAGRKRARVSAAHFRRYDRDEKALLGGGVTVEFYNARGTRRVSTLTAQRAEIDDRSKNMTASGGVVLAAEDSTRLETDVLCWHRESETITGEGRVTITRPGGMESGVGFEASSDLKRWSMLEVTTRLGVPDSTQQ